MYSNIIQESHSIKKLILRTAKSKHKKISLPPDLTTRETREVFGQHGVSGCSFLLFSTTIMWLCLSSTSLSLSPSPLWWLHHGCSRGDRRIGLIVVLRRTRDCKSTCKWEQFLYLSSKDEWVWQDHSHWKHEYKPWQSADEVAERVGIASSASLLLQPALDKTQE